MVAQQSPTIGATTFITFGAQLEPAYLQVATVEPAVGLNGFGLAYGAYRAEPVWMPTLSDYPDINTLMNAIESFRAQVATESAVAVVDQFGVNWPTVAMIGLRGARRWFNIPTQAYRLRIDIRLLVYATVPSGGIQ